MSDTPEQILRKAAEAGKPAVFRAGETLDAAWIIELATVPARDPRVHAKGVKIQGATIAGLLDFEATTLTRPLWLSKCTISSGICLDRAEAILICLQDCPLVGAISAEGVRIRHDLYLGKSLIKGGVHLLGAQIDGNFSCIGSTLDGDGQEALFADGMSVKGDLFLQNGFSATGVVRLLGAEIGGNCECKDASFDGKGQEAFHADGMRIKGDLFLRNGFSATGVVRLLGAEIGGNCECNDASFNGKGQEAFYADGIHVKGDVILGDNFSATGAVLFLGAEIGGDFNCSGAIIEGDGAQAFAADRLVVKGALFLRKGFSAQGMVNLCNAHVGVLTDAPAGWPAPGNLRLHGFTYDAIAAFAPQKAAERLTWLGLQPEGRFDPQPYEQLAKVLRAQGHSADAREILVEKERQRRKRGELGFGAKVWGLLIDYIVGYGYKPWLALRAAAIIIGIGGALFAYADTSWHVMTPAKERVYMAQKFQDTRELVPDYPRLRPLIYSADLFLPFVDLRQDEYWIPSDKLGNSIAGMWMTIYMWLHIMLGWGISALFVAGVTGLIKRD